MRIPARVVFPFGYVVKIREVTVHEMRDLEEIEAGEEEAEGLWDVDERTLYVLKCLTRRRKRYVVIHELAHALLDMGHEVMGKGAAKP